MIRDGTRLPANDWAALLGHCVVQVDASEAGVPGSPAGLQEAAEALKAQTTREVPGVDVTSPRSADGRPSGFGRPPANPEEQEAGLRDALISVLGVVPYLKPSHHSDGAGTMQPSYTHR
ncbi:hypothetical protein THAOC_23641, partial [Thalassiosira oceanica]